MKNEILTHLTDDPVWAEVISLYSGLFENKEDRKEFIIDISKTNLILAADCKSTSLEEEDEILDYIILNCAQRFKNHGEAAAIFTLIKLEEYFIIDILLGNTGKINDAILYLLKNNAEITEYLKFILPKLKVETANELMTLIKTNGYVLNRDYYFMLISLKDDEKELNEIYHEMINIDIEPNITLLNILIEKSSRSLAEYYFSEINRLGLNPNSGTYVQAVKKFHNIPETKELFENLRQKEDLSTKSICKIYTSALSLTSSFDGTISLKSEFLKKIGNQRNTKIINLEINFYSKLIQLSPTLEIASRLFNEVDLKYHDNLPFSLIKEYIAKLHDDTKAWEITDNFQSRHPICLTKVKSTSLPKLISIFNKKITFLIGYSKNSYSEKLVDLILATDPDCTYINTFNVYEIILNLPLNSTKILLEKIIKQERFSGGFYTRIIENYNPVYIDELAITLKKCGYKYNHITYNVLVKKTSTIKQGIQIIYEMKLYGYSPDKYSLSPLFTKCRQIEELFDLIDICIHNNIELDSMFRGKIITIIQTHKLEFRTKFSNLTEDSFIKKMNDWSIFLLNLYSELVKEG